MKMRPEIARDEADVQCLLYIVSEPRARPHLFVHRKGGH